MEQNPSQIPKIEDELQKEKDMHLATISERDTLRLEKAILKALVDRRNQEIGDLKAHSIQEGAELQKIKKDMTTMQRAQTDLLQIYHFALDKANERNKELEEEVQRLTEELGMAKARQASQAGQPEALGWLKLRRVQETNDKLKKDLEAAMAEIKELKLGGKEPKSDVEEEDDWKLVDNFQIPQEIPRIFVQKPSF